MKIHLWGSTILSKAFLSAQLKCTVILNITFIMYSYATLINTHNLWSVQFLLICISHVSHLFCEILKVCLLWTFIGSQSRNLLKQCIYKEIHISLSECRHGIDDLMKSRACSVWPVIISLLAKYFPCTSVWDVCCVLFVYLLLTPPVFSEEHQW